MNFVNWENISIVQHVIAPGFIILDVALLHYFLCRLLKHISQKEEFQKGWRLILVDSSRGPAFILLWSMGGLFLLEYATTSVMGLSLGIISISRNIIADVIGCWTILRFIKSFANYTVEVRLNYDKNTISSVTKLCNIITISVFALLIMNNLGISINGILAFGGMSGIAVGFSAKDMLASFFGTAMIYMDGPFKIGEYISSPDKDIEGVVENIEWRQTTIRTPSRTVIYVPNSVFTNIIIENHYRTSNRNLYEIITVDCTDLKKLNKIAEDIHEVLNKEPQIDKKQPVVVCFHKFDSYKTELLISFCTFYCNNKDFYLLRQNIMTSINEVTNAHQVNIASSRSSSEVADKKAKDAI
jgi:MscS family membrane protein